MAFEMLSRRSLLIGAAAIPLLKARAHPMTYAYYSPGHGTYPRPTPLGMPAGTCNMVGEPRDMIVACDLGRAVVCFQSGVEAWRRSYPEFWPRAIDVFEGQLFIGLGNSVEVVDLATGFSREMMMVPEAPAAIAGLSVSRHGGEVWVICCFDYNGLGSVRGYTITNLGLVQSFRNPFLNVHPRHAQLWHGEVFVCDTFQHRVLRMTLEGEIRNIVDVYYPNYIDMQASNWGVITAEHENRVLRWTFAPSEIVSIEMAAPVAPFNDATMRKEDFIALESLTLDPRSIYAPPKSICSIEARGEYTLYSPNSAKLYGRDLLVSDTDNHRVIVMRDGTIVTTVTGFNNPVTSVFC